MLKMKGNSAFSFSSPKHLVVFTKGERDLTSSVEMVVGGPRLREEKNVPFQKMFPCFDCFSFHGHGAFQQTPLHISTNLLPFKFDSVNKKPKL